MSDYAQQRDYRIRQNVQLALVRDHRRRNAQGHRIDCVCRECFEAWQRTQKVATEAFEQALHLLWGDS